MTTRSDKAKEYFLKGYNCSQSVFLAFADKYGLEEEQALKISVSFGAGMGRLREVCGAVSGMLLVCGMETKDPKNKAENYKMVQELVLEFKKKYGTIYCKDFLGLKENEIGSHVPEERTKEYYQKRPCIELVEYAVKLLEEKFE